MAPSRSEKGVRTREGTIASEAASALGGTAAGRGARGAGGPAWGGASSRWQT